MHPRFRQRCAKQTLGVNMWLSTAQCQTVVGVSSLELRDQVRLCESERQSRSRDISDSLQILCLHMVMLSYPWWTELCRYQYGFETEAQRHLLPRHDQRLHLDRRWADRGSDARSVWVGSVRR